jgi:hypothetical protein
MFKKIQRFDPLIFRHFGSAQRKPAQDAQHVQRFMARPSAALRAMQIYSYFDNTRLNR